MFSPCMKEQLKPYEAIMEITYYESMNSNTTAAHAMRQDHPNLQLICIFVLISHAYLSQDALCQLPLMDGLTVMKTSVDHRKTSGVLKLIQNTYIYIFNLYKEKTLVVLVVRQL